jgi:hypothetical protein
MVPITTAEGILEAERQAMRAWRRQVFVAKKYGNDPPTEVPKPRTHAREYYWTLGPEPEEPAHYDESDLSKPLTKEEVEAKIDEKGWASAEALEKAYHDAKALERELIDARKAVRKAKYKEEREEAKAMRAEHRAQGLLPRMAQERRRQNAIASIEKYAAETGEDVSDWIKELEEASLPTDRYPEQVEEAVNPKRIGGKLRLTPGIPRTNPAKLAHWNKRR